MNRKDDSRVAKLTPIEKSGRVFFLLAGGLLLGFLVSCACGPVR